MVSQSCYRIWQAGFFFSSLFQTPPRDEVFWEYKGGLWGRKKAQLRICSALCGRTEEKERWLNGSSLWCEKQPGGSGLAWALQAKTCEKEEPAAPRKASGVLRSDYCFFTDKSGEMRGIWNDWQHPSACWHWRGLTGTLALPNVDGMDCWERANWENEDIRTGD